LIYPYGNLWNYHFANGVPGPGNPHIHNAGPGREIQGCRGMSERINHVDANVGANFEYADLDIN